MLRLQSDQGIRNLSVEAASQLAGLDPDYSIRDLYNAIHRGEYPSWTLYIQVLTMEQAKTFRWNPFDSTKAPNRILSTHTRSFLILDV